MRETIKARITSTAILVLLTLLAFLQTTGWTQQRANETANKDRDNVVYVCSCLTTKSCPCMTEAKMQGPCACGTAGGPPMKAVSKKSAWAKENRKALEQ
jgi:hypothetical protein